MGCISLYFVFLFFLGFVLSALWAGWSLALTALWAGNLGLLG
jgi:hypothetical protein